MKKIIIIASSVIVLITIFLILLFSFNDEILEEEIYSVKTNYSYLSDDNVTFSVKVYSNLKKSLLNYANNADVTLHDRKEENVISVIVTDCFISNASIYNEKELYEYNISIKVEITEFFIEDCYLSLKFSNKGYTFYIGKVEINKKEKDYKPLNITNLYGLSSENNLSLSGLVISFNNKTDYNWYITKVFIGGNYVVLLDKENIVTVDEGIRLEEYTFKEENLSNNLVVETMQNKTYILPIKHLSDYYLYNCYLLLTINGEEYYISNFDYIKSNDLNSLSSYVFGGLIYEL